MVRSRVESAGIPLWSLRDLGNFATLKARYKNGEKAPAGCRRYEKGTMFRLLPGICDIVPQQKKKPRLGGAQYFRGVILPE